MPPAPRPELLRLLSALKDAPGDVAPRLVLADWLEEQGDQADQARAELLRLHCSVGLDPQVPLTKAQERRERELARRCGPTGLERQPDDPHRRLAQYWDV